MDKNNNSNGQAEVDPSGAAVKPVRIKKLRKCIVDAAPHIKPKRREEAESSSKQQQKTAKKRKCLGCPKMFDVDDVEGIYLHWKAKHQTRGYKEQENPYPSPSDY